MRVKERKISKSFWAFTLVLVIFLTNILEAGEVSAADVPAPTITKAFIGDKTISGSKAMRKAINGVATYGTIHVTLKDSSGNKKGETKKFTRKGNSGNWSVTLDEEVAKGDIVYVKQEYQGNFSDEVVVEAKQAISESYKDKLSMPTLEVWSENTFVIDADAVEDIVKAFLTENNKLENVDGKNFEGNLYVATSPYDTKKGIDVAGNGKSLTITFSDESTLKLDISDKVTVHEITEISTDPIIDTLKVVDSKITGRVDLTKVAAPERLRVEIVTNFGNTGPKDFCTDQGCSIDKGTKVFATVNPETGEFSYEIGNNNAVLGKDFGVIVKEYGKKNNCKTIQPVLATPEKTEVRDPRKLTDKDKEAIDKAIRDANTVNDVSKLPNGTGDWDGVPAVIQFDDSGNVKIFSGNDVAGTWDPDNDYKFVPEKNEDGSVKLKEGAEAKTTIPAKDLVKNLAPEKPAMEIKDENIVITPNEKDTDAKKLTVTYTDKKGTEQTITAEKTDDGKWTVGGGATVDQNGVVTLPIKNTKTESILIATVTDAGGLTDEEKPLTSEKASLKLPAPSEYIVSFDGNGGSGSMESKKVKEGDEYTLPENGFTAPENKEFDGWEINGEAKKVGDKITVTEDTIVTAKWKDKSGDQDPNDPGKQDPNDPGKQDPNEPGKQDPNNPETQKPNEKPENGGRVQPWPGYWWYFGNNTDPIQATEVKTQEKQEYNNHERYMYGYPDGTVRPEGMMTRAEAAALIARLAKLDMSNDAKPNFQDTESAWYNSAINAMTSKDLMFADKDGNFRPNQAITRAEFARALYGVDKKNDKVAPFEDVKGHEFEAAINQAYGNGRINGYPDGTFKPDAYIQRSEAARILNQYANRGVDFDGLAGVRKYLIKFTDIDESHWAYYEIMEAANSHEYKRVRGKQIETWLQILNK